MILFRTLEDILAVINCHNIVVLLNCHNVKECAALNSKNNPYFKK
jgi:hypothetical protein